jgi:hypothetical protein
MRQLQQQQLAANSPLLLFVGAMHAVLDSSTSRMYFQGR